MSLPLRAPELKHLLIRMLEGSNKPWSQWGEPPRCGNDAASCEPLRCAMNPLSQSYHLTPPQPLQSTEHTHTSALSGRIPPVSVLTDGFSHSDQHSFCLSNHIESRSTTETAPILALQTVALLSSTTEQQWNKSLSMLSPTSSPSAKKDSCGEGVARCVGATLVTPMSS